MLSAKHVPPGQTGQIEVSVRTVDLTAINKSVTVTTNDPRQPVIGLTLTGVVEPEFALSERNIYFGTNPKGREVVRELLVTVHPERNWRITGAQTDDQNVTVNLEPVSGSNGKKYRLVAIQKADTPVGYHFGGVLIKTTRPQSPDLRLSVRGIVTER